MKKKTITIEILEQVNNYYPYGGLMASSSSIATPSSSYPANQPYRYNGKELDRKNGLDWMDYGARHFAGHGQWTSPDPLAEKYYDWSPYVYCVGNPIKFVDPDGRMIKPGDFFKTIDAAAIDFGMFYNDNSIREDREMHSYIVTVRNDNGEVGYTYAPAIRGEQHKVNPPKPPSNAVASIHTHGGYSKDKQNNNFSGYIFDERTFSAKDRKNLRFQDIGRANNDHIDAYVATPNGSLQKYEHKTGKISTISTRLPSDVKDPSRLNRVTSKETRPLTILEQFRVLSNYFKLNFNYLHHE